jgi:hypothetical protein
LFAPQTNHSDEEVKLSCTTPNKMWWIVDIIGVPSTPKGVGSYAVQMELQGIL